MHDFSPRDSKREYRELATISRLKVEAGVRVMNVLEDPEANLAGEVSRLGSNLIFPTPYLLL